MNGRCLRSNNRSSNGEEPTECVDNMLIHQFKLGDIIWCRINERSWWPAQVVDEKCVASKPKKRKKDQVLVRLYGTFEHVYVELVNCVSKKEKIYGQENSSSREIFGKALEEDLSRMKSGAKSETRISKSNEKAKEIDETSRGKGQRKGKLKRTMIEENSPLIDSSGNPKSAKQVKIVIRGPRWRTQIERFKARNDEKGKLKTAAEARKLNNGTSTISSLDKKNSSISRQNNYKEKLTSIPNYKAPDSNYELNPNANKIAQIETSEAKKIKKLVAKIVKEVAAEEDRNEALNVKGVESHLEGTEHIEISRKKSYKFKNIKRRTRRRVENQDMNVQVTGVIDDTRDKIAGPSDVGNTNEADQVKILREQDFDSDNNERTKDTGVDAFESMSIHESQETNGVRPSQPKRSNVYLRKMEAMKHSETVVLINGDQRCEVVEDVSREQMDRSDTVSTISFPL